jgi:hypothetical protein
VTYPTTDFELDIPLVYIESTIPAGLTISEYRRDRPRQPTRWERLKRLAGDARVAASSTGLTAQAGWTR